MKITEKKNCRSCGWKLSSENILDLGTQTIVDFPLPGETDRGKAPLQLVFCKLCGLLQLRHTVEPDVLFRTKFWYRSSINEQMRKALADVVKSACKYVNLQAGDIAIDIGANDGTMLSFFPENIIKVGCEPSQNLQFELREKVDVTIDDFWSAGAYANRMSEYFESRKVAKKKDIEKHIKILEEQSSPEKKTS